MIRNNHGVSPVIATILVFMIVASVSAGVLFWGRPVIDNLEKKYSEEVLSNQFDNVVNSFNDVLRDTSGTSTVVPMNIDSHSSLSTSDNYSKTMVSYSLDSSFNFSVSDIDLNTLKISALENSIDRAEIVWLDDSRTCFLSKTKVLLADGSYKNIEDVVIGESVKTYDFENNKITVSRVSNVFHHKPFEMDDFYLVINNDIKVTPNHEFYTDNGWEYALNLKLGDKLFTSTNSFEEIFSVKKVYNKVPTYDLTVEGFHNYFIYTNGEDILVHNSELDTGWKSPQNIDNDDSNGADEDWDDTSNVGSQNDNYALHNGADDGSQYSYSKYLICTDFDFSIPDGSQIIGVEVEIDKYSISSDKSWDYQIYLIKGGTVQTSGDNKADTVNSWGNSDTNTYTSYGGTGDLWDLSLSESDVENSGFGVAISAKTVFRAKSLIDHVRIKVYYTNDEPYVGDYSPLDDSSNIGISNDGKVDVYLNATVYDNESSNIRVTFFNGSDNSPLGSPQVVSNGSQASYLWEGLDIVSGYSWYVKVDDLTNLITSDTWSFTTLGSDPPVALDDSKTTYEEEIVWIDVLSNDSDPDGDDLVETSIIITDEPSDGSCYLNETTGEIRYAPNVNFSGIDSFTYTVEDIFGLTSNEANVTITVINIPDAPVVSGIPDKIIGQGNSFTQFSLDSYVLDAEDEDEDINWAVSGNNSLNVNIDEDHVVTITIPSDSWTGDETITFTATDTSGLSDNDSATFNVTEAPVLKISPDQESVILSQNKIIDICFYISNTGSDELSYSIDNDSWRNKGWIDKVSPSLGTSDGESDKIDVTINSTGLINETTYTCNLVIDTNVTENDGIFTIELRVTKETIEIISPDSDDIWRAGSNHNITWVFENEETDNLNISLYNDGYFYMTLTNSAFNTNNGGNWSWNVPYSLPSGSNYSIRIKNGTNDFGNSNHFSINSPTGYAKNETYNFKSSDYENGNYTITTNNKLNGFVLIELWKNSNLTPIGKIWIVGSDSLIGNIQSSKGNIEINLANGWITQEGTNNIVKTPPNYVFKDNVFAVRLNQMVISEGSISSVQGTNIKLYLSLYNDFNREKDLVYDINLYFDGKYSSDWKDYLISNYEERFSESKYYPNGLYYVSSNTGCKILLMNTIFNAKLSYS